MVLVDIMVVTLYICQKTKDLTCSITNFAIFIHHLILESLMYRTYRTMGIIFTLSFSCTKLFHNNSDNIPQKENEGKNLSWIETVSIKL